MEIKYQVFISSTYIDLIEERQEVMNALLELDCIPSGMELFPATNEEQWDLIKDVIDACDYYLLILGGRYGSLDSDGIGYTEKEYHYAIEQGKPIIAFLNKEPEKLPKDKTETTDLGQKNYSRFRTLVQKKLCKYWLSSAELGSVVSRSLIMLQKRHPGIGWVRGNLVPNKEASLEILELKQEIDRLNLKLLESRTQGPDGSEFLAQGKDTIELHYSFVVSDRQNNKKYTSKIELDWDTIFYKISPKMIDETSDYLFRFSINSLLSNLAGSTLSDKEEFRGYTIGEFRVEDEDFETIKVQLRALGLITKSLKSRSLRDRETYWSLTDYGDTIMNNLRAIKK